MSSNSASIHTIIDDLDWATALIANITNPEISKPQSEFTYFMTLQGDLSMMKGVIFGYACIQEVEANPYNMTVTSNDECKSWQEAGTLSVALWYAQYHIMVLVEILELDKGMIEVVKARIQEFGREYVALLRSAYKTHKVHRLSFISDPYSKWAWGRDWLEGGEDAYGPYKTQSCPGNCHTHVASTPNCLGKEFTGCDGRCDIIMNSSHCIERFKLTSRDVIDRKGIDKPLVPVAQQCVDAYRNHVADTLDNELLQDILQFERTVATSFLTNSELHKPLNSHPKYKFDNSKCETGNFEEGSTLACYCETKARDECNDTCLADAKCASSSHRSADDLCCFYLWPVRSWLSQPHLASRESQAASNSVWRDNDVGEVN